MDETEIIITVNEVQEATPSEFLSRVRGISTTLRQLRANETSPDQDAPFKTSATIFDNLEATLVSQSQHEFSLTLSRANSQASTTIHYLDTALFIQRQKDEKPEQMQPDADGFGVVQFVTTALDELYKANHPDDEIIW